jgi:iron complex transport system permease protein
VTTEVSASAQGGHPAKGARPGRGSSRPGSQSLFTWPLLIGLAVVLALIATSLCVGEYGILTARDGWDMFMVTRVPRTVGLILSGAALAMCGLVMQMVTQNRFVEPTTTGTTEWAGLGLLVVYILDPGAPILVKMAGAIVASFLGTMLFFVFVRRVTLKSSVVVPIVGMMLGAVIGSVANYVALAFDATQSLSVWFTGSFTSVLRGQYEPIWAVAAVVVIIFITADRFTVAGLGRDLATSVGVNHDRVVLLGTALISVTTGIITVVVGNLPFLGLVVPNVVSRFRGDDLRSNLPWVALGGIALVTAADLLGRVIVAPFELPVSMILGVVGGVVFIGLLLKGRKRVR